MIYLPRAVIMYYRAYTPPLPRTTPPRNAGRKCNASSGRSGQSIRAHVARRVYSSLLSGYLLHRAHDEKFIRRFNTDARYKALRSSIDRTLQSRISLYSQREHYNDNKRSGG